MARKPSTETATVFHHLAPQGMAGFVLANGSLSSNQSGEGDIRRTSSKAAPCP